MRFVRSLAGIVAGFGIFFAIVRLVSGTGLWIGITATVAAAILSGYVTALIAGALEFPHVAAVGILMVVTGFLSMRQEGVARPGWHQIAIAGCGPVSAMIGAAIRLLTKSRTRANPDTSAPAAGQ
jgi:hypothetical protein